MDRGAWAGYCPKGHEESDMTEATQHAFRLSIQREDLGLFEI